MNPQDQQLRRIFAQVYERDLAPIYDNLRLLASDHIRQINQPDKTKKLWQR